jgi:hypothetical protein
MKKLTTLVLVLSVTGLIAQTNTATPNANFEHWTHSSSYDDPNQWKDLNSSTSGLGTITCFKDSIPADVRSGKYAVKLVTQKVAGITTAPGALTTGTINTTNYTISGGIAYTLRPDSIIGWYKYNSVSGDNGDVEFYLFGSGGNNDTVGEAFFRTPKSSVTSYTRISYPVTYRSSSAVATALWILSSSNTQASAQVNSELIMDSLGLVFDSVTGIKTISKPETITVGPNPARGTITIRNISNAQTALFGLFDITGRKVAEETIGNGTSLMDVTALPEGVYIYSVKDAQSAILKTGRIVIQK